MLAAVAFLDAFQKVADMATNTRGGKEQGWRSGCPRVGLGVGKPGGNDTRPGLRPWVLLPHEWAGCGGTEPLPQRREQEWVSGGGDVPGDPFLLWAAQLTPLPQSFTLLHRVSGLSPVPSALLCA